MRALALLALVVALAAAEAPRDVVVAIKEAPPFAIRDADGRWRGIAVELWEDVASQLGLRTRYEEARLQEILSGTAGGRFHAGLGAITATAERERSVDFSHPYFTTGLGIAVRPSGGWLQGLANLWSWQFLSAVLGLCVLLLGVGFLVWLSERRRNSEQFGGTAAEGLGSAFWWSAVTMTTVGYGDKAPRTLPGRLVALVWMFASIIIISSFTAAIATALTVGSLARTIEGPRDLPGVTVGVVDGTTGAVYASQQNLAARAYPSIDDALRALQAGEVVAVVHDHPLLRYQVRSGGRGVEVLANAFGRQDYAIPLAPDSGLREEVNRALLHSVAQRSWQDVLERYIGE